MADLACLRSGALRGPGLLAGNAHPMTTWFRIPRVTVGNCGQHRGGAAYSGTSETFVLSQPSAATTAASGRTATAPTLPSAPITTRSISGATYGLFAHQRVYPLSSSDLRHAISVARLKGFSSMATFDGLTRLASVGKPVIIRIFKAGSCCNAWVANSAPFSPGMA